MVICYDNGDYFSQNTTLELAALYLQLVLQHGQYHWYVLLHFVTSAVGSNSMVILQRCSLCRYYLATVDEILDDGSCSVIFDKYDTTEVTQVSMLRLDMQRLFTLKHLS